MGCRLLGETYLDSGNGAAGRGVVVQEDVLLQLDEHNVLRSVSGGGSNSAAILRVAE